MVQWVSKGLKKKPGGGIETAFTELTDMNEQRRRRLRLTSRREFREEQPDGKSPEGMQTPQGGLLG